MAGPIPAPGTPGGTGNREGHWQPEGRREPGGKPGRQTGSAPPKLRALRPRCSRDPAPGGGTGTEPGVPLGAAELRPRRPFASRPPPPPGRGGPGRAGPASRYGPSPRGPAASSGRDPPARAPPSTTHPDGAPGASSDRKGLGAGGMSRTGRLWAPMGGQRGGRVEGGTDGRWSCPERPLPLLPTWGWAGGRRHRRVLIPLPASPTPGRGASGFACHGSTLTGREGTPPKSSVPQTSENGPSRCCRQPPAGFPCLINTLGNRSAFSPGICPASGSPRGIGEDSGGIISGKVTPQVTRYLGKDPAPREQWGN